jgi:transposase-like protein
MSLDLKQIADRYHDDEAARKYLESLRWPEGVVCVHCGQKGAYRLEAKPESKKPGRRGLWKCKDSDCGSQFTVTVGTIFEDSHIPLSKWLLAFHLLSSSKKGMSAHQLHRMLGITYKSAWFMAHRIRYAMVQPPYTERMKGTIEVDETFVGGKPRRDKYNPNKRFTKKTPVVALVERGGASRAFKTSDVKGTTLKKIIRDHIDKESHIMTDEWPGYNKLGKEFASHQTVRHGVYEFARGPVNTNTVEGYFSLLKRSIIGTYHHISPQHMDRYLSELDFRYSRRHVPDGDRTQAAIRMAEGKRLTYRDTQRHKIVKTVKDQTAQSVGENPDSTPGG